MTKRLPRPFSALLSLPVAVGLVTGAMNPARASLNVSAARGDQLVEIPVAGRSPEVCVIPKHFGGAVYSEKDLANEADLCRLNQATNVAVCPKTSSTNPGLDFFAVPSGLAPQQIEANNCKIIDRATKKDVAKKLAKYKLSTSCSYTPSILAYYHISRILGGVLNVPVAVIRTVDLQKHIALGRKALRIAPSDDVIYQTWSSLYSQLVEGSRASKRDLLLTSRFDQSYGALLMSKKGDFNKDFFHGGADNVSRAVNFREKNPAMIRLANSAPMSQQVGRDFTAANVQKMVNMKDASDMVVMDTLLNQQDRYGNIDVVNTFVYLDAGAGDAGGPALKSSNKLEPSDVQKLGAVAVKRVSLSDNDCGVAKDNVAKAAGLPSRILHLDPQTYVALMKLNAVIDQPETKAYFTSETLMTENDYAGFRGNLHELTARFHTGCTQGKVKLDLGLQEHFSGLPLKGHSCEI